MNLIWLMNILNKSKKYVFSLLLLISITSLTACSNGSSSTVADVEDSNNSNAFTGVFLDSPVEGLNYQTTSMIGLTDKDGMFMYHDGETVTFKIGDLMLGSAPGNHIMTPIDLVPGAVDETHPTVTNISRMLQSIDWDGDPTNGIMITDTIRSEMSGRMIDFTKSIAEFDDYDVGAFFDTMHAIGAFSDEGHRGLRTPVEAQAHFRQTLMDDMHSSDSSFGPGHPETGMPQGNTDIPGNTQGEGQNTMNYSGSNQQNMMN